MKKILLVSVNSSFSHTNIAVRYLKYYADSVNGGDRPFDCAQGDGSCVQGDGSCAQGDGNGGDRPLKSPVEFAEFTINQPMGEILRGIFSYEPEILLFSTYIWNVEMVEKIARNIKALMPSLIIGAGGPEAGFRGKDFLKENPDFDLVVKGEGEAVFASLIQQFTIHNLQCTIKSCEGDCSEGSGSGLSREFFLNSLNDVKGLYLRNPADERKIVFTGEQELICDLGKLPFPYPDLEQLDGDHKIFYYESSRGCPFKCAYCMSSLDTKVRFVPLDKVFSDLQRFLDAKVRLVKFVDRTYNLKPERYISIWKYILEHHNGKTMFHFEIEGEFLSKEAMDFLQTVPEGIMQFEIGVQSSNPEVLKACGRSPETETLRRNILTIPKTIHTHLDLIAGLPFENLESFGRSFDFVMNMKPDALQLGFLKILFGAPVNSFCENPGWKWMKTPPYEVLETPYLSYSEILFLKDLETALDAYWNDHNFDTVMNYLSGEGLSEGTDPGEDPSTALRVTEVEHRGAEVANRVTGGELKGTEVEHRGTGGGLKGTDPLCSGDRKPESGRWWSLFTELTAWLRSKEAFNSAHQKDFWAEMLHLWLSEKNDCVGMELLRFDYIASGKKTNPPAWLKRKWDKDGHYDALQKTTGINNSRLDFAYSDFDSFGVCPPVTAVSKVRKPREDGKYEILFLYPRRESDHPSPEQRKFRQIRVN